MDHGENWNRARHLAGEETTVSMAAAAAEKALKRAGADPSEVELLIVATISGDTVTPSTACRVQALIGADKAVAFDINAAGQDSYMLFIWQSMCKKRHV